MSTSDLKAVFERQLQHGGADPATISRKRHRLDMTHTDGDDEPVARVAQHRLRVDQVGERVLSLRLQSSVSSW